MDTRSYNHNRTDSRNQLGGIQSTRIVKGNAVQLDPAAAETIKYRKEARSIQDELKSIKPVTSPFSELFFDDAPIVTEPIVAEHPEKQSVGFEDAFLESPVKPIDERKEDEFDDIMDLDEPATMQWTKARITGQDKMISALSEPNAKGDERINLTKDMLQTAQVIAQVEDKFIIIKTQGKLCVVDQHAADERVALEKLENALFDPSLQETTRIELTKKHLLIGDILKATSVLPAKRVVLTESQMRVVRQHREVLAKWHFRYKPQSGGNESILLTGVPSICGRLTDVTDFLEFVDELGTSTGGYIKPECVKRILASQACRYAIMFGDKLTHTQCEQLITNLSKCTMAFICAHGRPSVIPLVDLDNAQRSDSTPPTVVRQSAPDIQANSRGSLRGPRRVIRPRAQFDRTEK